MDAQENTRQDRRRIPMMVAAGAAVLVLVAVGLPILFFGGRDSIVIDQPTMTLPPSPVITWDSWQRVGADVMQPVETLLDMTQAGSRLIAVGLDPGEEDSLPSGVIFASDDGVTWTRLAEDDVALTSGMVIMHSIAEAGPGLVAVGAGCEDDTPCGVIHPIVWTSVDGNEWTRSAADQAVFGEFGIMLDVIATDHGIVAVGSIAGDDPSLIRPAVWLSPDGAEWERVWEGDFVDTRPPLLTSGFTPGFEALAVNPDGLIVGVGLAENGAGELVAAVWVSGDGRAWERIETNPPDFRGETGLSVTMLDVAWGSSGFTAVGTDGGAQVAIWQSPDGLSWTRIDTTDQPFDTTGTLSSVAALDTGFVTAGPHAFADQGEGPVTLWTSPDGSTWDRVHTIGPGDVSSIVVTDAGIAVAGAMPEANDFHAAVWVGPAFDPDAPPPDPLPTSPSTTIEEPPIDLPKIGTLNEGASCEELATLGYSYAETVTYWARYEMPADLDPDANGLPCEDAYPASDVTDVYGGPEAASVHIASDLPARTFAATGPAVDAGIVCPTGTTEFTSDNSLTRQGAINRWQDRYTCDDGSGTFLIGADIFVFSGDAEYGVWSIVSGTGTYESLRAGGGCTTSPTGPDTWSDDMTGRLWFATDEN